MIRHSPHETNLISQCKAVLLEESGTKLFMDVWHGTRKPFSLPFKESKQGSENDAGYSGRGFYFFADEDEVQWAVPSGVKRAFSIKLNNAFKLDDDDIFSEFEGTKGFSKFRDQETLKLLELGYDGAYRTIGGKIEEICVFSYKSEGYDGNKKIKFAKDSDWETI